MKIAICGFGFSGATLPLANSLVSYESVSSVECYYFVYWSNKNKSIESIDYDDERLTLGFPHAINKTNQLYNYLSSKVKVYVVPLCPNGPSYFHTISKTINQIIIFFFALRLLFGCHFINIVAHTELEFNLIRYLKPFKKVIVSVHEIFENLNKDATIKKNIKELSKLDIDLVFHSNNVRKLFEIESSNIICRCHTIPFSYFFSYISYKKDNSISNNKDYVLFIGSIQKYKGLSFLKKVFDSSNMDNIKLIIAGKGYVPEISYFKERKNTIVINRYISNQELVSLITFSSFVVCPYLTASQTGIAPTSFAFNKSVIATNVGAFNEIIVNGKNGYLVEKEDIIDFRNKILILYNNKQLQQCMGNYILQTNNNDWCKIANKYINIFKK